MKRQKGQAFILVLILLALGTLIAVPTLKLSTTALRSQRITENALTEQYNADSAVQDALYQLLSQFMGDFTPSNPTVAYDFTYGGKTYHTTIQIPSVPPSQDMASGSMKHLLVEAQPSWMESTTNGTTYVIRLQTQPWSATTATYEYTLPAGFTYTPNSAYFWGPDMQNKLAYNAEVDTTLHKVKFINGTWTLMLPGDGANYHEFINQGDPPPGGYQANNSYLVITTLGGQQHLKFKPFYTTTGGNRTLIQTIHADGNAWGVHYLTQGSFVLGSDTITFTQTAAVGVAMYTILVPIGGTTYRVTVAYDAATGTFKIISYQIV